MARNTDINRQLFYRVALMKRFYFMAFFSFVQAQTLQETIDYSLAHNYQVQILEQQKSIASKQEQIVSTWDDPILQAGINDIQGVQPLSRNNEAMQNQFMAVSQKIPLSNRIELATTIAQQKQHFIEEKQEAVKVEIAFGIRQAYIEAKNAQENLKVLDAYINFLKQPLELITALSAVESNSIEKYIQTQLLQENFKLQRHTWLEKIEINKERIELIGNLKIDNFSDEVPLQHYQQQALEELLAQIRAKNPKLKSVEILQEVAQTDVKLARAKEQADVTITGGYYQRFDRNDYISLTFSMPIYTHHKQEYARVQAMKQANIQDLSYQQTKVELEQGLKIALHQLKALYAEYSILKKNHQKIKKLIANSQANLRSGGALLHYYELFTQKTNNRLVINQKRLNIALIENQISQFLGEI